MMDLRSRLMQQLRGWGPVGLLYILLCTFTPSSQTVLPETFLDRAIPFNPAGVWIYLSFFILVPLTYLVVDTPTLRWLTRALQASGVVAGTIFLLWPTTLHYPTIVDKSVSAQFLVWMQKWDSRCNCLPSLHAALTVLCAWALSKTKNFLVTLAGFVWGLAILYTVIQVRQHVAVDLSAGMLLGLLSGIGAQLLQKRSLPDAHVASPVSHASDSKVAQGLK
ncbi:phosphatase PAP2 family protein (plasmid) [Cupriavidus pinatubonensis]|uniref:phosphatase PAP2 family protein n=1 Tax=Cupriavidus pinatubonensis TaxID=248026 RepID=UPI001C7313B9|nr:phosphatase PAP2 family protein [Cupriavidus pinatubonensis]QYY34207.1 phosphatase PAP2 family protein [Cupriavidus pinatubonensis]